MTVVDVLRAGRAAIVRDGWRQGPGYFVYPAPPGHCALQALVIANASLSEDRQAAQAALLDANGRSDIIRWNDTPGRTVDEVLALYDKAIAAEEAKL